MPHAKSVESLPYIDDYLLNLQAGNYSPETVYNYERDLAIFEHFIKSIHVPFDNVSKKTVLYYKAYLISRDRKTAASRVTLRSLASFSINRMLSSLRSYLKFLIDQDHATPVAPTAVTLVKTERHHPRVGEFNEIVRLIEVPTKLERHKPTAARNRAMLEVLFSTGMRISELTNLKINAIDTLGRIFVRGKGKKERFVYLTERAHSFIQQYLKLRGHCLSPYLFIPYRGRNANVKDKKISPNYVQERVKRYRELLGINVPISPHSIRHAFATYLAENGANPAAIQILLGHESLDTTTRYVHASDRYAESVHKKYHPLKE